MAEPNALKAAALEYASRGWAVFPLVPHAKTPLTTHGVLDASKDLAQIETWWTKNPDANVGIACGEPSGFFVVDIDPRNGGDTVWNELVEQNGYPVTHQATTGSGGTHLLFNLPAGYARFRKTLGEGIDLQSTGKYIVAPPSLHPDGGVYDWDDSIPIADAPQWLLDLALKSEPEEEHKVRVDDPNDNRPGTRFNQEMPIEDLLIPHGWTLERTEGQEQFWCRPGKPGGISATWNNDGTQLFYVFTSSTDFEQRGYDKVGVHAVLNFGGDVSAALADISETWVGPAVQEFDLDSLAGKAVVIEKSEPYSYSSILADNHFISEYVEYANKQTDAALEYHEAGALSLLALATSNLRASLAPYPNGLRTNLYLCLVGSTTRSRKSTSQNICEDLANSLVPLGILPSKSTTEALVNKLAYHVGSTIWMPDELGMNLAEISSRTHLQGVEDLLLTLYGGKEYVYAKVAETVTVKNAHLSVLGAATPESLALMGPTAMLGGLLPRFGIVFPAALPEPRPAVSIPNLSAVRAELLRRLRQVVQFTDENTSITFDDDAVEVLNHAEGTLVDTGAHTARLPAMLYKVAVLIAAGRLSSVVGRTDAECAREIVFRWRDGANRLQPFLRRKAGDIEFDRVLHLTMRALSELGGTAHRSAVAREIGTTKQKMDTIQATLEDRGYIKVDRTKGEWQWLRSA